MGRRGDAGTIGNGDGDGHRPPLQGINAAAWAIGGEAERVGGSKIEDWRSQLGGSAFAQQLRRDTRDDRRRKLILGEEKFMDALMRFTQSAKRSQEPAVAVAARRWEGKIHFHVRAAQSRRSASQSPASKVNRE